MSTFFLCRDLESASEEDDEEDELDDEDRLFLRVSKSRRNFSLVFLASSSSEESLEDEEELEEELDSALFSSALDLLLFSKSDSRLMSLS